MLRQNDPNVLATQHGFIHVSGSDLPDWMLNTASGIIGFSAWVEKIEDSGSSNREIFGWEDNGWLLRTSDTFGGLFRIVNDSGGAQVSTANVGSAMSTGVITLFGGYIDFDNKDVVVWRMDENSTGVISSGVNTYTEDVRAPSGTHVFAIGDRSNVWVGSLGMVTFYRDVLINEADMANWWQSKDYWGLLFQDNTGSGGAWSGCDLSIENNADNFVCFPCVPASEPTNDLGSNPAVGAFNSGSLSADSIMIIRGGSTVGSAGNMTVLRGGFLADPANAIPTFVYNQNIANSGFFTTQVPGQTTATGVATGVHTAAYNLANNTFHLGKDRILSWSNSRGVRGVDANLLSVPDNYAHGIISNKYNLIRGIINAPLARTSRRWFAIDAPDGIYQSNTTNTQTQYQDFAKFWTNGNNNCRMMRSSGGIYAVYARSMTSGIFDGPDPTQNSVFTRDKTWVHEVIYLNHPGGGQLNWIHTSATGSNSSGTEDSSVGSGFVNTDTALVTTGWTSGTWNYDTPAVGIIQVSGFALTGTVTSGHMITVHHTGVAAGSGFASLINTVTTSGNFTLMTLATTGFDSPASNAIFNDGNFYVNIGPYSYGRISYSSSSGSTNYRGPKFTASFDDQTKVGCFLLGANAFASGSDVSGFIIGTAGYGGLGYGDQASGVITPDILKNVLIQTMASGVFMHFATQGNINYPEAMADFANILVTGSTTGVHVGYIGDQQHQQDETTTSRWTNWIVGSGDRMAVSTMESTGIGSALEQYSKGWKANMSHPNYLGMKAHMNVVLDQLLLAAQLEVTGIVLGPNRFTIYANQTQQTEVALTGTIKSVNVNLADTRIQQYANTVTSGTQLQESNFVTNSGLFQTRIASGVSYGDDIHGRVGERRSIAYTYGTAGQTVNKDIS